MGSIKHAKTSTIPAPADATRISGPDWNEEHDFNLGIPDIAGLSEVLIPMGQVVEYRDQALEAAVAAIEARDAAQAAAVAAVDVLEESVKIVDLSASTGALMVGYEAGTVASKLSNLDMGIAGIYTAFSADSGASLIGLSFGRTQESKNAEVFSVTDAGAVGNGAVNCSPFFQAAIDSAPSGASITLHVPHGTWKLDSNVVENGRIVNWAIDRAAVFTGVGAMPPAVSSNYGSIPVSTAALAVKRGSLAAPVSDAGSPLVAELRSSKTFTAGHANAAIAGLASKHTTADNAVTQGAFFEAIDKVGWGGSIVGAGANNFVEGVRAHGITEATGGSGYGVIAFGGAAPGIQWKYIVGIEGDVSNSYADMAAGTINPDNFAAAFVATSRGTKTVDAAFAVNPFTTAVQKFQAGFLVAGATSTHTGFKHTGSGSMGIDLKSATLSYSAMRIPNNIPMHASNNVGTDVPFFYMHTDGIPAFGSPSGIRINLGATGERIVQVGAADSGGAGFRMLRVAN